VAASAAAARLEARLGAAEAARAVAAAEVADLKTMCAELMGEVERGLARGGGVDGWVGPA
jgi:hypothetical protein